MSSTTETQSVFIAVDCGASSSRVIAFEWADGQLKLNELHRFETPGYRKKEHIHWDFNHMFSEILRGLRNAGDQYGERVVGIGVDTWGVDYGLIDASGKLLNDPFQYRDDRTNGSPEWMNERMDPPARFEETGVQDHFFNTSNQLYADLKGPDPLVKKAAGLLFYPDLINYRLCGVRANEYTIASTAQLLEAHSCQYSKKLLEAYSIPEGIFQNLVNPGTILGSLVPELASETGLSNAQVIAVASHDTGSAFAASPQLNTETAFLSSGTWSLIGIECTRPYLDDSVRRAGFSNEGGVNGTIRLLRNIIGLWLIQECVRTWAEEGNEYTFAELDELSRREKGWSTILNADYPSFVKPGGMPDKIRDFCAKTGQAIPESPGAIVRVIQDSLALAYTDALESLENLSGRNFTSLNIVGGGSQSKMLNQLTADATGLTVHAGPIEATALGNVLMQMLALGAIESLEAGRSLVARSFPQMVCQPTEFFDRTAALARYRDIRKLSESV